MWFDVSSTTCRPHYYILHFVRTYLFFPPQPLFQISIFQKCEPVWPCSLLLYSFPKTSQSRPCLSPVQDRITPYKRFLQDACVIETSRTRTYEKSCEELGIDVFLRAALRAPLLESTCSFPCTPKPSQEEYVPMCFQATRVAESRLFFSVIQQLFQNLNVMTSSNVLNFPKVLSLPYHAFLPARKKAARRTRTFLRVFE
jgi:hypothetical protein